MNPSPAQILLFLSLIISQIYHKKKPTIENNDWLLSLLLCLVGTAGFEPATTTPPV